MNDTTNEPVPYSARTSYERLDLLESRADTLDRRFVIAFDWLKDNYDSLSAVELITGFEARIKGEVE